MIGNLIIQYPTFFVKKKDKKLLNSLGVKLLQILQQLKKILPRWQDFLGFLLSYSTAIWNMQILHIPFFC